MSQYTSSITGQVIHDIRYVDEYKSVYDFECPIISLTQNQTDYANSPSSYQNSLSSNIKKFSPKSLFIKENNFHFKFSRIDIFPGNLTVSFWTYIQKYPTVINSSATNHVAGMQIFLSSGSNISYMHLYPCWNDNNNNYQGFQIRNNSSGYLIKYSASMPSLNAWHHCAFTRSGSNVYWFIDGTLRESGNSSYQQEMNCLALFGRRGSEMYFDDICIIKGQALWTSAFAVPNNFLTGTKIIPHKPINSHKLFPWNVDRNSYFDKAYLY